MIPLRDSDSIIKVWLVGFFVSTRIATTICMKQRQILLAGPTCCCFAQAIFSFRHANCAKNSQSKHFQQQQHLYGKTVSSA
mmetsp:Transcript_6320/g.14268  ORF Transcript_6320/g.14268 Transcript_6320/m.14268 type:complete len:81 (-) Transcript_6320:458-700(-)